MILMKLFLGYLKYNNLYLPNYSDIKKISFNKILNDKKMEDFEPPSILYAITPYLDSSSKLRDLLRYPTKINEFNKMLLLYFKNDIKSFLIKLNVYDLINFDYRFNEMYNNGINIFSFISGLFNWASSLEGYSFWKRVHIAYIEYIKNKLASNEK